MTLGGDTNKTLLYRMGLSETDDNAMCLSSVTLSGENMSDLDLMRFFEFDNADLAANRMGKLSDKQAREINTSNQKAYRSWFGYIVFLVLLGAFISFLLLQDSPSPRILPEEIQGLSILWSIVGVLVAIIVYILWASRGVDYSIFSATGPVRFEMVMRDHLHEDADGQQHYETEKEIDLYVGDTVLENVNVDEKLKRILREGNIYKFYYLKNADGRVLSAELIA